MARTSTITMIPLDRVAHYLGIDPFHFNGITSQYRLINPSCPDMWYQYDWQASGRLSREDLAAALHEAEDKVTVHLGYSPIPQWHEEEVAIPPHYRTEVIGWSNAQGQAKSVRTSYGLVWETGAKTSSFIDTPATVFSDEDGDGLDETVTVSFATTVTEEQELHLFYPGKNGREEWEIRPLTSIDIAAGIATIVFKKYLVPLQVLVEEVPDDGEPKIPIDGDDNTNFLQTVDVYRVYSDPSQQITFYHLPGSGCDSVPCEGDTETGCLFIKDRRLGILSYQRADWDADTESYTFNYFSYEPIKAKIYYKAGWKDNRVQYPHLQMDVTLERMISFYALSLLDRELCGCSNTRNIWEYMTEDMSLNKPNQSHTVMWSDLANPLGTSRVAIQLWKHIQWINRASSQIPA